MRIRLVFVLPVMFVLFETILIGSCFLTLGHGGMCGYVLTLMYPAVLVIPKVYFWGLVMAFIASLAQYGLIGYLADRVIRALGDQSREQL